jgi:hypothetical protein
MDGAKDMFGVGSGDLNHVYRGIWIGGHTALQSGILTQHGIRAVINGAMELADGSFPIDWGDLQRNGISVQHVPMDDTPTQPLVPLSPAAQAALHSLHDNVTAGRPVLVNCAMGISRSSSLVIAYLIVYQHMSFDEAYGVVLSGRPQANPNPGFVQQLQQLAMSQSGPPGFPATMAAGLGPQFPLYAPYAASDANWEYYRPALIHHGGVRSFFGRLRNF